MKQVIAVIVLSLFLLSCGQIQQTSVETFIAANANDIELSIDNDFVNTQDTNTLKFTIKNNINANNDFFLTVTPGEFIEKVTPFQDEVAFTLIGDKQVFSEGEERSINLGGLKFSDLVKRHPSITSSVFVNLCSDYDDIIFGNVCVYSQGDHCGSTADSISFSGFDQRFGGPITISDVEFRGNAPGRNAELEAVITLRNNEAGNAYTSVDFTDACKNLEVIEKDSFKRDNIDIEYIRIGDDEFTDCRYFAFGYDGDITTAKIECSMPHYLLSPGIDSDIISRLFSMKINYNYVYNFKELLYYQNSALNIDTTKVRRVN